MYIQSAHVNDTIYLKYDNILLCCLTRTKRSAFHYGQNSNQDSLLYPESFMTVPVREEDENGFAAVAEC
jgi:hypothetical protein